MNFKKLLLSSIVFIVSSNSLAAPKPTSIVYENPKVCTTLAMLSVAALSIYKYQDNFKYNYGSPFL